MRSADTMPWKAPVMLVLATAFWALSFPTMKAIGQMQQQIIPEASSWFSASLCMTYRFGVAGLLMLIWCAPTIRRVTMSEVWEGVGLAAFASGGLVFQMDGLAYTSASTSAFLTQCYCLIIPIWVAVRERRWPSPIVVLSCLLVVVGVGVLSRVDLREFKIGRGELETLIASVIFTAQILWLQRPCFAHNNVRHFTMIMFVMIAVFCLPVTLVTAQRASEMLSAYSTAGTVGALGILVVFSTLGGYLLMNRWQPLVSATQAGLIYCVEPVFASAAALFMPGWFSLLTGIDYPNERVGVSLLVGGGLITIANVLIQVHGAGKTSS